MQQSLGGGHHPNHVLYVLFEEVFSQSLLMPHRVISCLNHRTRFCCLSTHLIYPICILSGSYCRKIFEETGLLSFPLRHNKTQCLH